MEVIEIKKTTLTTIQTHSQSQSPSNTRKVISRTVTSVDVVEEMRVVDGPPPLIIRITSTQIVHDPPPAAPIVTLEVIPVPVTVPAPIVTVQVGPAPAPAPPPLFPPPLLPPLPPAPKTRTVTVGAEAAPAPAPPSVPRTIIKVEGPAVVTMIVHKSGGDKAPLNYTEDYKTWNPWEQVGPGPKARAARLPKRGNMERMEVRSRGKEWRVTNWNGLPAPMLPTKSNPLDFGPGIGLGKLGKRDVENIEVLTSFVTLTAVDVS